MKFLFQVILDVDEVEEVFDYEVDDNDVAVTAAAVQDDDVVANDVGGN